MIAWLLTGLFVLAVPVAVALVLAWRLAAVAGLALAVVFLWLRRWQLIRRTVRHLLEDL